MPPTTPDDIDRHIGRHLRAIRRSRRISAAQIAKLVGISEIQVGQYERGTSSMSAATLYRISVILDAPVMAFYEGVEETETGTSDRVVPPLDLVSNDDVRECLRMLIVVLSKQHPPQS